MENPENSVDGTSGIGYNKSNEIYDVIRLDDQKPIHDTSCTHPQLIADPDDTLEDAVYHGCANPKCGVGFYIRPAQK